MEETMNQSSAARLDEGEERQQRSRPAATFKQGGVAVSVWKNGDMFNATIRNSYKDEASGDWKDTTSYSPADLAVASQLTSRLLHGRVHFPVQPPSICQPWEPLLPLGTASRRHRSRTLQIHNQMLCHRSSARHIGPQPVGLPE
jgi:hypothetical protein